MLESAFAEGRSPLHRLNPHVKVVTAVVCSVVMAMLTRLDTAAVALGFSVALVAAGRLRPGALLRRLLLPNALIGFLWLTLPWSTPGRAVWTLGPLVVTAEGVRLALLITVKCNAILVAMAALLATCTLHDLAAAVQRLGMPRKLVLVLILGLRYLHVIRDESVRLRQAATVRGFVPRTNIATYRTMGDFLGSLLVRSDDRATRIYGAMRCRGFDGRFPALSARHMRPQDWIAGVCLLLLITGLGVLEWQLSG
jgi:cobalt/nickel transport system permease protein